MGKSSFLKKMRSSFSRRRSSGSVASAMSQSSDNSNPQNNSQCSSSGDLPPPVLVYHESARSIVFRDHLPRAVDIRQKQNRSSNASQQSDDNDSEAKAEADSINKKTGVAHKFKHEMAGMANLFFPEQPSNMMNETIEIQGFQPNVVPLPHLELGPNDEFTPLLESNTPSDWTPAKQEVVQMLKMQHAIVKTIKNSDWTSFLHHFKMTEAPKGCYPDSQNDIAPHEDGFPFNSFVTSMSLLLPEGGRKMCCFGAAAVLHNGSGLHPSKICAGCGQRMQTWSWPSGYSAKTEFNIDP
jgi:hypothetical protein